MMSDITGIIALLIPIFISVVLPIMIVWLKTRRQINADKQRSQVLIEAIKSHPDIDPVQLAEILKPKEQTKKPKDSREQNLTTGLVCTMLGLAIGGFYFLGLGNRGGFYFLGLGNISSNDSLFLLGSMCLLAVGISFLIVYFVSKPDSRKA